MPCKGNKDEICGDDWRINVYEIPKNARKGRFDLSFNFNSTDVDQNYIVRIYRF